MSLSWYEMIYIVIEDFHHMAQTYPKNLINCFFKTSQIVPTASVVVVVVVIGKFPLWSVSSVPFCLWKWEYFCVVEFSLSMGSSACFCWDVCVSVCYSAWVCVFHVGHPMGTKRAVCSPSGAEMYTLDNRRLQFSIGAAFLIVPHVQWAFLSLSFCLCVSFSLYSKTMFLMRDWRKKILIGCWRPSHCSSVSSCLTARYHQ